MENACSHSKHCAPTKKGRGSAPGSSGPSAGCTCLLVSASTCEEASEDPGGATVNYNDDVEKY